MENSFKLRTDQIVELIPDYNKCIATNKITVDGEPIGYMYREESINDVDSGLRFFSDTESQEYVDDAANSMFSIAHYDRSIIPSLDMPIFHLNTPMGYYIRVF